MLDAQSHEFRAITLPERCNHRKVFVPGTSREQGIYHHMTTKSQGHLCIFADGLCEKRIAGRFEQCLVKRIVDAMDSRRVPRLDLRRVRFLQYFELSDQRCRCGQWNQRSGMRVQHLSHGTDLFNLLPAEIADHRAAAALPNHHSLALEFDYGLANQVPGRAKALDEFILDQAFTGPQTAKKDVLLECSNDSCESLRWARHCESIARDGYEGNRSVVGASSPWMSDPKTGADEHVL